LKSEKRKGRCLVTNGEGAHLPSTKLFKAGGGEEIQGVRCRKSAGPDPTLLGGESN